jgi:DNA polymerase III subunit epsilon
MELSCRDHCFRGFDQAVVLDVETTGLDPKEDRIVTVAAIKVDFPDVASTGQISCPYFETRVNPGRPIPAAASKIHGIMDHHVADDEMFADIAHQLRDFIGELPIVGHNIQFDKRFLNAEFKRARVKTLARTRSWCTMQRIKEHLGYTGKGWRWVSLAEAAEMFRVPGRKGSEHNAKEDAMLALQVAVGLYVVDNGLDPIPKADPSIT